MKTLVVGIGSTILGDDGVGVHAARAVRDRVMAAPDIDVDVVELGTAGLALLDLIEGYDQLIVLDAIVTGAAPGTVHRLEGQDVVRAAHLGAGHDADLPATLAMGEKLLPGQMPKKVTVIGIEALNLTDFSEALSEAVEAGIEAVVRVVEGLVE